MGAYELNLITCTGTSTKGVCEKTRVPMFYFDSKTARPIVPLWGAALVFWKAYIDRMLFGYADCISNTQFISFFVHKRKSWDHFSIIIYFLMFVIHYVCRSADAEWDSGTVSVVKLWEK